MIAKFTDRLSLSNVCFSLSAHFISFLLDFVPISFLFTDVYDNVS